MKYYPDLSTTTPADHLLFDLGFSLALIHRAKQALQEITECGDYPIDINELLMAIQEFETGRLQIHSEIIYDNAQAAVEKACLLSKVQQ